MQRAKYSPNDEIHRSNVQVIAGDVIKQAREMDTSEDGSEFQDCLDAAIERLAHPRILEQVTVAVNMRLARACGVA